MNGLRRVVDRHGTPRRLSISAARNARLRDSRSSLATMQHRAGAPAVCECACQLWPVVVLPAFDLPVLREQVPATAVQIVC